MRVRDNGRPPSILDRWQYRKPFSRPPQIQCIGSGGFFLDSFDPRRWRAAPAHRNHLGYDVRRSRKQRLDAAVPAVAHPSLQIARHRLVLDPIPKAAPLPPAPDRHLTDGFAHYFLSPRKSAPRALISASRGTRPAISAHAGPFKSLDAWPRRSAS